MRDKVARAIDGDSVQRGQAAGGEAKVAGAEDLAGVGRGEVRGSVVDQLIGGAHIQRDAVVPIELAGGLAVLGRDTLVRRIMGRIAGRETAT